MKVKRVLKWSVIAILLGVFAWLLIGYWTSTNECFRNAAAPNNPIKAIVHCEYGSPDVLELKDVERPTPNDNQVLVKVRAAAVNPLDLTITGPLALRPISGLRKPRETRVGVDYSGTVEAIGKNVTNLKTGDEVFGGKTGAFAEYICVLADRAVALKPSNVTFEEAAAVPVAGITALQGLRDKGHLQAGQKVLVNGASGGVGTFAVQIAKAFGAEVTGVCSTRNLDLIRSIGADHVIDYSKEDFTLGNERYDLIFDLVCNHSFAERRRILTPNGVCVMAGLGGAGWHDGILGKLAGELYAIVRSPFMAQKFIAYIALFNQKDVMTLADLLQSGKIKPVIDRTYQLSQVSKALWYLQEGHARGKVVITVD